MIYQFREGAHVRGGLSPQVVGEALAAVEAAKGGLEAEDVVAAARPKRSPLHAAFEWDDSLAAEEFRKTQARSLIAAVIVVRPETSAHLEPKTVRAFVSVAADGEQRYTSTLKAMEDPELRRQIVDRALREFKQWRSRYEELSELAEVFAAAERVSAA